MKSRLWMSATCFCFLVGVAQAEEQKFAALEAVDESARQALLSTAIEPGWPNAINCGGQILTMNYAGPEEVEYAWCWSYDCLTVRFDRETGEAQKWRVVDLDGLQPFEERIYQNCADGTISMSDLSRSGKTDLPYLPDAKE